MITEKLARERETVTKNIEDAIEMVNTDFLLQPNLIFISFLFLLLGLLTGFFARKFINVTVFLILTYVGMTTLESLGIVPEWMFFNQLGESLFGTGKATIGLFTSLLDEAPVFASGLFLVGGVIGLFSNR